MDYCRRYSSRDHQFKDLHRLEHLILLEFGRYSVFPSFKVINSVNYVKWLCSTLRKGIWLEITHPDDLIKDVKDKNEIDR